MTRSASRIFLTAAVIAVPLATVLYPAVATLAKSLFPDGALSLRLYADFVPFRDSPDLEALEKTVLLSVASAVLAGLIGIPLGILLEWFDFPGKTAIGLLLTFPMVLPPLIGTLAFHFLYGESGIVPRGLQRCLGLAEVPFRFSGIPAVLLVHAYTLYVYFYLFVRAACRRLDRSSIEAARALGARGSAVIGRVVLPLLAPAIGGAALLVFMTSMASFSAPFIFATSERILALEIFHARERGELPRSLAQTTMLVLTSLAALALLRSTGDAGRTAMEGHGIAPRRVAARSKWAPLFAGTVATVLAVVLLLPHATVVLISFAKNGTWTDEVLPPRYTLENYAAFGREILAGLRGAGPLPALTPAWNSIWMTAISTAGNVVFGCAAAYLLVRVRPRGARAIETLIMLSWALPGTAVAVNLLAAFPGLTGAVMLLPLAYFIRSIPVLVRSTATSLSLVPESIEEAARSLGAGPRATFRRVVLPLVLPGVLAGGILTFVTTLGEFVSSILLYTPRNEPISVQINEHFREYNFGSAAAYGVMLLVLITIALVLARRFFGGGEGVISG